ncbi:aldehyde dehydrogenase family protein [Paraconexibacter antarcticus]|uniref:Aldehyde dehydrogenase family protein n=1 Tax=Paraconexibacter antarcticus TaxID=2949664 RepID=A0ABY5DR45_9ACTN|nr:aldehyde dehydrogenase family protein [Paraconexibacter antarcticus]UTI64506.1 aldehyde dehydrogenase family protein [Paraconexibacter antarcticus]
MPSTVPAHGPTIASRNPATGETLGTVPVTLPAAVPAVVAGAAAVQPLWWALRSRDRARYMQRAAQAVIDEADDLAALICAEQGRPRAEVELQELLPAIETLQWLAEAGPKVLAGERAGLSRALHPLSRARWTYEPLGVVAVIGPATEPFATPLGDVAVALMAGNAVVLKPSPQAALAGERIARVFARAGLPEGLLRVVHGDADTGAALVDAPVAQVRFTGSYDAGRAVGEACARAVKRSVLELGGKDVALVLADADVDRAVQGTVWAAFANAGQAGGSVERAVVLREVSERFLSGVLAATRALRVGDPRDPGVSVGPLLTHDRHERVRTLVQEAVDAGATLHCGGPVEVPGLGAGAGAGATFYAPAVLTGVTPEMRVAREELPGPVLVVMTADTEEEAIRIANASDTGLGASVWTADRYKGARIARELHVGMVWMNDHLTTRSAPQLPWGGVKGSGIGRARGAIALRTCAEPKVLTWSPPVPAAARPFWWFPYDEALERTGRAISELRSVRDRDRERALRQGTPPMLKLARRALRRR